MSYVSDNDLMPREMNGIYRRGNTVFDETDCDCRGGPTRKQLWVWEMIYEPFYEKSASPQEQKLVISYYVKDGPGEDAKVVGRVSEEDLYPWYPTEENLIDL